MLQYSGWKCKISNCASNHRHLPQSETDHRQDAHNPTQALVSILIASKPAFYSHHPFAAAQEALGGDVEANSQGYSTSFGLDERWRSQWHTMHKEPIKSD
jgi:hypothetical protein